MSDKYNKEWLLNIRVHVRAASNIIPSLPSYWTGEEDPEEIKKLKLDLVNFKTALTNLEVRIYKMEKKCQE